MGFRKTMGLEPKGVFPDNPTTATGVRSGIVENQYGKFGYIRIEDFLVGERGVNAIRKVLFEDFGETDGLMIDIRDNPGGNILVADVLSQLFTGNRVDTTQARLLNNQLNADIVLNNADILGQAFVDVVERDLDSNSTFTDAARFIPQEDANTLGQGYYGPVAVLTNARSFSAADLFTCGMRDNGAALIFGEEPLTGAGGANVITHELFTILNPSAFEELPDDHTMRVSWRQAIRFGEARGRVIEDFGCDFANKDIALSLNDIQNGSTDQLETISRELGRLARWRRFDPSVNVDNFQGENAVYNDDLTFPIGIESTRRVQIRRDGEFFDRVNVNAGDEEVVLEVDLSDLSFGDSTRYTFEGNDFLRRPLWNIKRTFTHYGDKIRVSPNGTALDLTSSIELQAPFILNRRETEDPWRFTPSGLEVGFQDELVDINSAAVFTYDLSQLTTAQLNLELEFDSRDFNAETLFISVELGEGVEFTTIDDSQLLMFEFFPLERQVLNFDLSDFAGLDNVRVNINYLNTNSTLTGGGLRIPSIEVTP